jgi:DNA-binding response OmpR family regulator
MSKRILIVDDSEIVLDKAREALEAAGFRVLTAMSALEIDPLVCGVEKPDLIIMDVMMPVLDGDKKARMLKDDESARDIPILLLSSKTEEELRYLVRESGADGFIRKPFAAEQLVDSINLTLARGGQP